MAAEPELAGVEVAGVDYPLASPFPQGLAPSEPFILGIDEAGRGPVLGPMVYAAAFCPAKERDKLAGEGYADSKVLTDAARERLFAQLRHALALFVGWRIRVIGPEEMSGGMLAESRRNLNEISHQAALDLIRHTIAQGFNVTEVYIDTVGDPKKYAAKVERAFPRVSVVVSKKADSLFPIVSAASIAAKVTRDRALAAWQFREESLGVSREFGSGYPGDETTRVWLRNHVDKVFGFPSVVRFSWKPVHVILGKSAVGVRWSEYGEEEEGGAGAMDVDDSDPSPRRRRGPAPPRQQRLNFSTRSRFFADNGMEVASDL